MVQNRVILTHLRSCDMFSAGGAANMAKGGHGAPADNVCQCTAMTDYCRIARLCAHGACAQPLFRFIDLEGGVALL